ncbi:MAG TPA: HAD-IA family hydrolase [Kribbella sp.]
MDSLRRRVDTANQLRQDARFSDLAVSLPALLDDLRDAAEAEVDRNAVQTMAAEAMHDVRAMTKKLGHLGLAWMAAELAGQAARQTDDQLLAAANAWNHIEVYKAANAPGPARALALATIDQLADGLGATTPGHLSLWGTMHLQAGLIAAYWNNREDANAHLQEAAEAAGRLGGDANHYDTMFGMTNVAIHQVAVAVELGDAQRAIDHGNRIEASKLGRERRARLGIDLARAFEHACKREQALNSLLAAEKLAPDYVRPHPLVREIVGSQAPSRPPGTPLVRQADRGRMTDNHTIRVAGLLFDNDGVLVDSTAAVEASWCAFASWYDLPVDDVLERVHGRRSRDVIAHYADRLPVSTDEAFARYIDACIREFVEVDLLPGAAALIAALPAQGWAVVTSGTKVVTQARWKATGLADPPVLVSAEDVAAGKPKPDPYRTAAQRLRLDPAECLAIEDSPAGLASARAAGCTTLALLTTHLRADLDADVLAADLTAVRITDYNGFKVVVSSPAA